MSDQPCPFCDPQPAERIFYEDELTRGLWDGFPVSPGHALLIPRRHVAIWFDATLEEQAALARALSVARELVAERHRPDGYNVGINVGEAAGQTVFHLHIHLIPRYSGDVADPRGGVRHVIPSKGNYLLATDPRSDSPRDALRRRALVSGGDGERLRPAGETFRDAWMKSTGMRSERLSGGSLRRFSWRSPRRMKVKPSW